MTASLRAFADSNVLLSAARRHPNRFQPLWTLPGVEILTSQYSIGEVSRNLTSPDARANLWQLIYLSHLVPEAAPDFIDSLVELPEKDRPILASAIVGKADILITGDKHHFGIYYGRQLHGVLIELPETFRERYPAYFQWA